MTDPSSKTADYLEQLLKTLSRQPGVYQMLNRSGEVIYVGKAKNLRNRVKSYFHSRQQSVKTRLLVRNIADIQVTVTNSEVEALLLENNLIKKYRPRYNVVFRDDKSYPYIYLSRGEYPRLTLHRGARKRKGDYFGPFPNSGAARESLSLVQKVFRVRQCEDSYFANRSRPCLQYQIKRCSAPCVKAISADDYGRDVDLTRKFYQGKNEEVIAGLQQKMDRAATELRYEEAAGYRDQIRQLRKVLQRQVISGRAGDLDVIAVASSAGTFSIFVLFVRQGQIQGSKAFYPKAPGGSDEADVLSAFLPFYYLSDRPMPEEIITSLALDSSISLEQALTSHAGHKVRLTSRVRGQRGDWLALAAKNVGNSLRTRLNTQNNAMQRLDKLGKALSLDTPPARIECFDISHHRGEATVASCVVFVDGVPRKPEYRLFNIEGVTRGDDYAAMEQALQRRYRRLVKEDAKLPDLILIDGGAGQLGRAEEVMQELELTHIPLLGVAKGADRKAGMEQLQLAGQAAPVFLEGDSEALHLIQHVRDESHRFAITRNRKKLGQARKTSTLEAIPGIGPKRRQQLLRHFGGLQEIGKASIADLAAIPGFSMAMAKAVYDHLH